MTRCAWWQRAWHRQRRSVDLEVRWPALRGRADTVAEARVAWDVFLELDDQAHWRCPCGAPIADLFHTLTLTVSEEGES